MRLQCSAFTTWPTHLMVWNDEFGQAPYTEYFLPKAERTWEVNPNPVKSEQLKIAENLVHCFEGLLRWLVSTAPVTILSNCSLLLSPTAALSGSGCTGAST